MLVLAGDNADRYFWALVRRCLVCYRTVHFSIVFPILLRNVYYSRCVGREDRYCLASVSCAWSYLVREILWGAGASP